MLKLFTLFRLFGPFRSQANSLYIPEIEPSLISQSYQLRKVKPTDRDASLIDEVILKTLSTPSGKSICAAFSNNYEVFKSSLFLTDPFAKKGFRLCQDSFISNMAYRPHPKSYYYMLSSDEERLLDGWTTPGNETFIFLDRNTFDIDRLTRTLIHELVISYDRKEQIGVFGILDYPKIGIKKTPDACKTIPLIRDALLKHTLSAARAFDMENRIVQELGLEPSPWFTQWQSLSCGQKIKFLSNYTKPMRLILLTEEIHNMITDRPMECRIDPSNNSLDFHEKIELLEKLKFDFTDGTQANVCDFMVEGWPFYPGINFRGGPGPRIGGAGWDAKSQNLLKNDDLRDPPKDIPLSDNVDKKISERASHGSQLTLKKIEQSHIRSNIKKIDQRTPQ